MLCPFSRPPSRSSHRTADIRCAVACVPKTIDNDIGVIDRSFGFDTSVEVARQAIRGAYVGE